jgi:hypothetical protein
MAFGNGRDGKPGKGTLGLMIFDESHDSVDRFLNRGVTTPTTHRSDPVAAGGRALNENQRPGAIPEEGVRKSNG